MGKILTISESGHRVYWNSSVTLGLFPNKIFEKPSSGGQGGMGGREGVVIKEQHKGFLWF